MNRDYLSGIILKCTLLIHINATSFGFAIVLHNTSERSLPATYSLEIYIFINAA